MGTLYYKVNCTRHMCKQEVFMMVRVVKYRNPEPD